MTNVGWINFGSHNSSKQAFKTYPTVEHFCTSGTPAAIAAALAASRVEGSFRSNSKSGISSFTISCIVTRLQGLSRLIVCSPYGMVVESLTSFAISNNI